MAPLTTGLEFEAAMNYDEFKALVLANGWTIRQLRSDDAPPSPELLDLMDRIGLVRYERFVLRLQREAQS
jgi:hypothetical protein